MSNYYFDNFNWNPQQLCRMVILFEIFLYAVSLQDNAIVAKSIERSKMRHIETY